MLEEEKERERKSVEISGWKERWSRVSEGDPVTTYGEDSGAKVVSRPVVEKMDARSFVASFLLLLFVTLHQAGNAERLKMCVVESIHTIRRTRELCPRLLAPGSQVECVIGNDRFNCLRRLTTGNVHFTILEPEDLVAASAYNEYNILVTTELRLFPDEKKRFEMVALVYKEVKNVWDMKGRRFCHPGIETQDGWTKAFSTYFENWIIPKQCDPEKTLLENRIAGLSDFFESACIAGPWSADTSFDSKLKSKYRNLCGSCGNPAGCYANDKYYGPEGALLCLTDNAGDIAWVRLDDALEHFKDEQIDRSDYSYLCPDGTTRPVDFWKPCVWLAKPWPVIVARSEMAEKVSKLVRSLKTGGSEWQTNVLQLMEGFRVEPVSLETSETPEDYLRKFPGFVSAYNRATCQPSRRVEWCVSSNLEDRKCRWLREASFVYGIEPAISCIQVPNRSSCLDVVSQRRADLFVAKPEELLPARRKGLVPIVQAMPKKKDLTRIAAVVRGNSRFHSLKDLRGAKACFAGYKDIGWNTFVHLARNISGNNAHCSDARLVSDFFKDSCVLGLTETDYVPYNLHSLCTQAGRPADDVRAFECVSSGLADVAIVNLKYIENKIGTIGSSSDDSRKSYKTLCLNEADIEAGSTCLLTSAGLSMVIVNENTTSIRHEEIYSMLLEMDRLFGPSFKGETPAFSLYDIYDVNHSVIFPEATHHLEWKEHRISREKNYNEIVEDIVKETPCSSAISLKFYLGDSVILLCVLVTAVNKLWQAS